MQNLFDVFEGQLAQAREFGYGNVGAADLLRDAKIDQRAQGVFAFFGEVHRGSGI